MSSQNKTLLAFGEVLFDIINGQAHMGGAPFNVAAHFARHGNYAYLISAIGNDANGKTVLEKSEKYNVSTKYVKTCENRTTGVVDVTINASGQPSYNIVDNVAWDYIDLGNTDYENIKKNSWDCFYFGMLAQRSETNRITLDKLLKLTQFRTVFLDVNLRKNYYSKEQLEYSLSKSTILKLNDEEIEIISPLLFGELLTAESFANRVSSEYDINVVIITLGANGAAYLSNTVYAIVPGVKVTVADTVGAGDSFSAAFLNAYLKGENIESAVKAGCSLGANVASKEGAIPEYDIEILNYK